MIRHFIRKTLQRVGYDIVKYHSTYVSGRFDEKNLEAEFVWLKKYGFKTILDIGANEGQFADKMNSLFPEATIYSFEPLPDTFAQLEENFRARAHIKIINVALGDSQGELQFNRNEYSPSSSFLELSDTHKNDFDFAVKVEPVKVTIDTLDNIMKTREQQPPLLVKIDVQGYEDKVIRGGLETIRNATMVISEVSFVELYKGQLLFEGINKMLNEIGFFYAGSIEQLRSPETNQILQADAVFIRRS